MITSNIPPLCNDKQVFAQDGDEIDALQSTGFFVSVTVIISIPPDLHPPTVRPFEGSQPLRDNDEIFLARFHILFIVYFPSAPFSMLESLSYAMWVPCIIKVSSVVSVKL